MAVYNVVWAEGTTLTEPSDVIKAAGFVCGAADPLVFNWLFGNMQACLNQLDTRVTANTALATASVGTGSFGTGTVI